MSARLQKTQINKILKFIFGDTLDTVINKDMNYHDEYQESPGNIIHDTGEYMNHKQTSDGIVNSCKPRLDRHSDHRIVRNLLSNNKFTCKTCSTSTETVYCDICKAMFHTQCAVNNKLSITGNSLTCNSYNNNHSTNTKNKVSKDLLSSRNNLDLLSLVALKEYTEFPNDGHTSKFEYAQIVKILIKLKNKLNKKEMEKLTALVTQGTGLMDYNDQCNDMTTDIVQNEIETKNKTKIIPPRKRKTPLVDFILGICQIEESVELDDIVCLIRNMILTTPDNKDV